MTPTAPTSPRAELRQRLLSARQTWAQGPTAPAAQAALDKRLAEVLAQLEPDCLGLYWPMKGEFNPRDAALTAQSAWGSRLALPYADKTPVAMHFRPWSGEDPTVVDACGIPSTEGKPVVPDVVLVPCVGFTAEGYRLGYGGGYFDRFLADHPGVTAIGLAWDEALLPREALAPQAHDIRLMAVVTPSQIWG
ncbi:MAG: 5-formyltetrahydrofolate cyclo-ligase [Aquabacterium sp.]|uniref:5-formyltetrahydrofolate cyclo-ligase n=1 Tax=Aquabacterium sp. TaxID=1872578 RepID=UPI003BC3F0B6